MKFFAAGSLLHGYLKPPWAAKSQDAIGGGDFWAV
jgi:hypothetical protein